MPTLGVCRRGDNVSGDGEHTTNAAVCHLAQLWQRVDLASLDRAHKATPARIAGAAPS